MADTARANRFQIRSTFSQYASGLCTDTPRLVPKQQTGHLLRQPGKRTQSRGRDDTAPGVGFAQRTLKPWMARGNPAVQGGQIRVIQSVLTCSACSAMAGVLSPRPRKSAIDL